MKHEKFYAGLLFAGLFSLGVFVFQMMKMETNAALETQRLLARCGGDNASR